MTYPRHQLDLLKLRVESPSKWVIQIGGVSETLLVSLGNTKDAEGITIEFGRHRWRLGEFAADGLLWSPVTPFRFSELSLFLNLLYSLAFGIT